MDNVFVSLKALREELVNTRISAADSSIWSMGATIQERAFIALRDAFRTYPFAVRRIIDSVYIPSAGGLVIVPPEVDRVTQITPTLGTPILTVTFKHLPTPFTNLVQISVVKPQTAFYARIEYESKVGELPRDIYWNDSVGFNSGRHTLGIVDAVTLQSWPNQAYAEISSPQVPLIREIVLYNSIAHGAKAFCSIQRGQAGSPELNWSTAGATTIVLSPVVMIPPETLAVVMKAAEANMYEYWAGHRAMYDQYSAIVGETAMSLSDILALTRVMEDRADRRYLRLKGVPAPTRVQGGKRTDTGL